MGAGAGLEPKKSSKSVEEKFAMGVVTTVGLGDAISKSKASMVEEEEGGGLFAAEGFAMEGEEVDRGDLACGTTFGLGGGEGSSPSESPSPSNPCETRGFDLP